MISVCVASHDRALRLRWLLEALREQTADDFELVVAHDSKDDTRDLLAAHPLFTEGNGIALRFEAGSAGPAEKRNAAWRASSGDWIWFTDDDCRPPPDWVARCAAASASDGGRSVLQGRTTPDPDELGVLLHAPHARSQEVEPPTPWAQTCNIGYPRAALEATGGFDERLPLAAGEDTDLAVRAAAAGFPLRAVPEVLTHHCVEDRGLRGAAKDAWRWQHLPFVVREHPQLRRELPLRVFWKPQHARLPLALAGVTGALRAQTRLTGVSRHATTLASAALVVPWALSSAPRYGAGPRARVRALSELPGRLVLDAVELAALARGSVRHRSLLL